MRMLRLLIFVTLFTNQLAFPQEKQNTPTILTLEHAIEIALEQSYNMKLLKLNIIQARENLNAARGRFRTQALMYFDVPNFSERLMSIRQANGFPIYNTIGTYQYQGTVDIVQPLPTNGEIRLRSSLDHTIESYLTSAQRDTTERRFLSSISLTFTQPLFTVNSLKYGLKRAKLNFEKINRAYSKTELDIIFEVTAEFYNLYKATRQNEIAAEQTMQQEKTYQLAKMKYEAGLIPEVEALQMEVDLADSKNKLLVAHGALKRQSDYFKQLIAIDLDEEIAVRTDFDYKPFPIDSATAIAEALKNRTEMRERAIELELAKMSMREVDSKWQIRGDLSAFYDLSGVSTENLVDPGMKSLFHSSITDLKNRPQNKGITFRLTVPLWDWGVNRAEVAAAQMDVRSSELALQEQKKTIIREIRSAINYVRESEGRLDVLLKSQVVAQQSYQISLHRFENGDITSQDLVLDQQRLTSAKIAYLDAFIDYKLAIADLKRKTMYDFEAGRTLWRKL